QTLGERIDGLGESLVEAPLVLGVLAAEAVDERLGRLPQPPRECGTGPLRGAGRGEAVLDPDPDPPQAVGERLGRGEVDRRAHRAIPTARPARVPGSSLGPTRRPSVRRANSRSAPSASYAGSKPSSSRRRRLSSPRPKRRNRTPSP